MHQLKVLSVCVGLSMLIGCSKEEAKVQGASSSAPSNTTSTSTPASALTSLATSLKPTKPAKSYEGPFGLAMGLSVAELTNDLQFKHRPEISQDMYMGQPPKPVSGFDKYLLTATEGQGLCRIVAIQEVNVVNDTGDQLKSGADTVAEMITERYGKHTKKYDSVYQDVYRRNPQFWMMALREDSAVYSYDWNNGKAGLSLPNEIKEIEVDVGTSSSNTGYIRVIYVFNNHSACKEEAKKKKSKNF